MRKTRKPLITAMCALVLALGVNATYAWLTDTTVAVTNTFTVGNIDITLTESDTDEYGVVIPDAERVIANEYKMVPGMTYTKDPVVTVEEGSEDCWLFVKVDEQNNSFGDDKYIQWSIDSGEWAELEAGVWYAEFDADADPLKTSFNVIAEQMVTVNENVTKVEMDAFAKGTVKKPSLTFTAYAVQKAGVGTASDAWGKAQA